MKLFHIDLFKIMKISARNLTIGLFLFLLCGCLEKEKGVSLGSSVMEKKITMTSSLVDGLKVDIYLISDEAVEGELLAKAMNSSGQEIGRSKQTLALQKDDAKLISFTFDSKVDLDRVSKFLIDFRRK